PAITEACGAAQRSQGSSTHPQRNAPLHRRGGDGDIREVEVLSRVARFPLAERRPQCAHRVVRDGAAPVEPSAEEVELLPEAADTDAEDQPATADHIERSVAFGDLERVVVS